MSDRRVESSLRGAEDDQAEETDFGKGVERSEDKLCEGDVIAGKYRIEKVIGKGGMGVVLKAHHVTLDEPVAIKVLRSSLVNASGMVARFIREARAASKIKSHHVVHVTDVDTLPSGTPYMVMEYLEGVDLLALRRQKQGLFEIGEAVDYIVQACDAIAEAHAIGIVHRDLKPGNLFLASRRDGRTLIKVLDFGISKIDNPNEQDTTRTGQLMGSPKYMSPEQMLGLKTVDGRADIWALGTILYEFFAGRPPFTAENMPALCTKVLHSLPDPPRHFRPDLPQELEDIVLRCLQKEPEKRFAGVGELMQALLPFAPEKLRPALTSASSLVVPDMAPGASQGSHTIESVQTPRASGTGVGWDAASSRQYTSKKRSESWIAGSIAAALVLGGAAVFIVGRNRSPAIQTSAVDTNKPQSPAIIAHEPVIEPPSPAAAPPEPSALVPPAVTPVAAPAGSVSAKTTAPLPPKQKESTKSTKPVPVDPFGGSRN